METLSLAAFFVGLTVMFLLALIVVYLHEISKTFKEQLEISKTINDELYSLMTSMYNIERRTKF